jgi:hypothetical protein
MPERSGRDRGLGGFVPEGDEAIVRGKQPARALGQQFKQGRQVFRFQRGADDVVEQGQETGMGAVLPLGALPFDDLLPVGAGESAQADHDGSGQCGHEPGSQVGEGRIRGPRAAVQAPRQDIGAQTGQHRRRRGRHAKVPGSQDDREHHHGPGGRAQPGIEQDVCNGTNSRDQREN